jgi:PAS domain S-box-containing protein
VTVYRVNEIESNGRQQSDPAGTTLEGMNNSSTHVSRLRAGAFEGSGASSFRSLLEPSQTMVALISPSGRIFYISPDATEGLGYTGNSLVGESAFAIIHPDDAANLKQALADAAGPARSGCAELRFKHKFGEWLTLRCTTALLTGENPEWSMILVSACDPRADREPEHAVSESDGFFRSVFLSASVGVKVIDVQSGRLLQANPAFERMLGYDIDELRSRPFEQFIHPDDLALVGPLHAESSAGARDSFQVVQRYLCKDGSELCGRVTASLVRDADGEPRLAVAMVEDVGREHAAVEARRVAEERYRLIVETANEGIWILDVEGVTTFANAAMAAMLGTSVEELQGRSLLDFVHEEALPYVLESLERRRAGISEQLELQFRRGDGSTLHALVSARPLSNADGSHGALAMVIDISELHQSRQAVTARLHQLERIAELGRLILDGITLEDLLDRASAAVASALGVDFVSLLERLPDGRLRLIAGSGWEQGVVGTTIIEPDESQSAYQLISGKKRLIVEDLEREDRFTPPKGLLDRGVRSGLGCRIDGDDGPFGVIAAHTQESRIFSDDDANFLESVATKIGWVLRRDRSNALREAAEEELRDTAERFRMLADNAQDIVFRLRLDGNPGFEYVSPAIERITGFAPEEFYADPGLALKQTPAEDRQLLVTLRNDECLSPVLIHWNHPDGNLVWLEGRATYVRDGDGHLLAVEGVVRDVTERIMAEGSRRSLERQLHLAQKMEAVGRLAGGVAHDFNNLLLAMRGYGELALRRLGRHEDGAKSDIEEMLDAADRAAGLTRQLLAFGGRQVMHPQVLNLNDVVEEMDKLLQRLIGENIELVTIHTDQQVLVEADRSQLEQVIANLAVNARDAMADGGRLTIEVGTAEGDALFSVTDSGVGMDAETAARIFEPFFSTKGEHGTGLGLATVHGIVNQIGGTIEVVSELGRGTRIGISFPLSDFAPAPHASSPEEATGGAETILVVEDEPSVRTIVSVMLSDQGYNVLVAGGGQEALAAVASSPGSIDLVLSDLIMPGMSGRETADRIRELQPGVKVLYMSGYTDDTEIRVGALPSGTGFLQKPFGGQALADSVRSLLDQVAE